MIEFAIKFTILIIGLSLFLSVMLVLLIGMAVEAMIDSDKEEPFFAGLMDAWVDMGDGLGRML